MVTKTAKVTYKPTTRNVTDTITVKWGDKELISKEFYIAPLITWTPAEGTLLYVNEKTRINILTNWEGGDITLTNFKVVDNLGSTVLSQDSIVIGGATQVVIYIDYTPVSSQVDTGVQFTISYELGGYNFSYTVPTIPVYSTTGTYSLTAEEGSVVYDTDSTIVLSSDDTNIPTGETITFTSTEGLNATDTLKEN